MGKKIILLALCVGILFLGIISIPGLANRPPANPSASHLAYPYPLPTQPYPPPEIEYLFYLPVVMR